MATCHLEKPRVSSVANSTSRSMAEMMTAEPATARVMMALMRKKVMKKPQAMLSISW